MSLFEQPLHKETCILNIENKDSINNNNNINPALTPKSNSCVEINPNENDIPLEFDNSPNINLESLKAPAEYSKHNFNFNSDLAIIELNKEGDSHFNEQNKMETDDFNNFDNFNGGLLHAHHHYHDYQNKMDTDDFNNFDNLNGELLHHIDYHKELSEIQEHININEIPFENEYNNLNKLKEIAIDKEYNNLNTLEEIAIDNEYNNLNRLEKIATDNEFNNLDTLEKIAIDNKFNILDTLEKIAIDNEFNNNTITLEKIAIDNEFYNLNSLEEINLQQEQQFTCSLKNKDSSLTSKLSSVTSDELEASEEDPNKLKDSVLPDIDDKSDISNIEHILKNCEFVTNIDEAEKRILLEKIEETREWENDDIECDNDDRVEKVEKREFTKGLDLEITDLLQRRLKDKGINIENVNGSFSNITSPDKKTRGKVKNKEKLLSNKRVRDDDDSSSSDKTPKKEIITVIKTPKNKSSKKVNIKPEEEEVITVIEPPKEKRIKKRIIKLEIEEEEEERVEINKIQTKSKKKFKMIEVPEEDESQRTRRQQLKNKHEEPEEIKTPSQNSSLPSKQITEIKKSSSKNKSIVVDPNQILKILFLEEEDKESLDKKTEKGLKKIKCEISEEDDSDIYICSKLSKDPKLLISINKRKPILTMKWIEDSISNKIRMPYDKYTVKDKEFEKKYSFELIELLKDVPNANHLAGYSFFVTDHTYNKDELEEIIATAGGEVIESLSKGKKKRESDDVIIIADKDNDIHKIKQWKAGKINYKIFNLDFILDSVYTNTVILNKVKYKL